MWRGKFRISSWPSMKRLMVYFFFLHDYNEIYYYTSQHHRQTNLFEDDCSENLIITSFGKMNFFFFFEKENHAIGLNSEDWRSCKKKDTMSCGTCSTQTDKGKECLALWAKACATALPCRTTWEKEKLWKEFFKVEMSWMRWPPCTNS